MLLRNYTSALLSGLCRISNILYAAAKDLPFLDYLIGTLVAVFRPSVSIYISKTLLFYVCIFDSVALKIAFSRSEIGFANSLRELKPVLEPFAFLRPLNSFTNE